MVIAYAPLRKSDGYIDQPTIPDGYTVYLKEHKYDIGDVSNLTTYNKAITSPQSSFWMNAINDEMNSMLQNDVWILVELLKCCRPIGCKWVFKTKRDAKGQIESYKVRLVVKGYSQRKGIQRNLLSCFY